MAWAGKFGGRLDDVPYEQRWDILKLLLDQVVIDRDNNIRLTLGIPTEDMVSIRYPETGFASQRTLPGLVRVRRSPSVLGLAAGELSQGR